MNILNKYTYLFLGLLGIAGIVILVFLPNLETEEFSQDVIDDIIEGVTTTSILEADTNEVSIDESLANFEDELIISIQDKSQIEEKLLYNNFEKEIDSFDTYLLIGSDERSEKIAETRGEIEGKRADVIILGLVEKGTDEITLLSFPRDLLIENNCTNNLERINAAYTKNECGGRAENLAAAIFSISGIRVDHFASFDFEGFEEIIDSVDGIEVCVDETQREGFSFELQKGCQTINGLTTLNWVVSRSTEVLVGEKIVDKEGNDISNWRPMPGVSDLSRIERQQYVVMQLINELRNFESINELYGFINALENAFVIDENLTINRAVDILWTFRNIDLSNVKKLTTPVNYLTLSDGRQVLVLSETIEDFLNKNSIIDS
ncbi:LCP family protein [Acidimicrobiaceae bacterium]|mgnify:FL=1|jgi:LCP family protein required for cell wall assembly|nr:LCP family protein [Acidimicrobiaceae bacterium]